MKIIHLTILLMFILSMFSITSVDLVSENSPTLTEKFLDEENIKNDKDETFFQNSFAFYKDNHVSCHILLATELLNPYLYTSSILRPPIFS